jgi:hypothetical protein
MEIADKAPSDAEAQDIGFEESGNNAMSRVSAALLATWRIPLFATLVLLVLTALGLIVARSILPKTTTYISQFHFTFPSAETGRYPNGTLFSINELLDPAILDRTYRQLGLDKYGIKPDDFYGAFSIRPFLLTESDIAETFRQRLADRRLSFAERERIEQQLKNEFEQASRTAAELSFTIDTRLPLPRAIGRAVVLRVPLVWSQQAIEKKGILRIPGFSAAQSLISQPVLNQQPLPVQIVSVTIAGNRLRDRLTELLAMPGVLTTLDPSSGESVRDVQRDIQDLQFFLVNPLRVALVSYRFSDGDETLQQILERRIADLESESVDLDRQADAIGQNIDRFVRAVDDLRGRPVETRSSETGAASGGTTIPQIGESFIDRIIELTRADRDSEQLQAFVTGRTIAQYDVRRRALAARTEQAEWKELLAALRSTNGSRKELDPTTQARITEQLHLAAEQANSKWATVARIEGEFAANRIGRTAEIFAPYATPRDVVVSDPIFSWEVLSGAISALVAFFIGIWITLAALV